MSRKTWAISIFVLTSVLYVAGPLLVLLAGETWGAGELMLPNFYAFAVVGLLIALHRSDNSVAWICLLAALGVGLETALWGVYFYGEANPGRVVSPGAWAAVGTAFVIPAIFLITTLLLLVFPGGHLPSPRWRWFARVTGGLIAIVLVSGVFLPNTGGDWVRPAVENPVGFDVAEDLDVLPFVLFGCVVASVVALVRRFRRSIGIERLQLRWLATAGAAAVVVWAVAILVVADAVGGEAAATTFAYGLLPIPVAIGVAVLRYRLFEIDRLISRTVTYALVVGVLAGVFAVVVIGLPRVVGVPPGNQFVVAASTLAVAALFNPLRRRIQERVDRRFNRARYDAQQEVERLAERIRDEVELEDLTDEMLDVVEKTMQPSAASVWIRGED
jgi:hypothetical protein